MAPRLAAVGPDDLLLTITKGDMFSDTVFDALFRRAKVENIAIHGFRSSFRDWAGDETDFPREVIEAVLGHLVAAGAFQTVKNLACHGPKPRSIL